MKKRKLGFAGPEVPVPFLLSARGASVHLYGLTVIFER
jgi:hypothetical protein